MATVAKRRWTSPTGEKKEAWTLRYVDRAGAHRQETFRLRKAADARRIAVEGELAAGMHIARGAGQTVAAVAEVYLRETDDRVKRGSIRPASARNYQDHLRIYIVPEFGGRLVHEIETLEVEEWLSRLHNSGKLSPKSVSARLMSLKMLFDCAIRQRWAKVNPVLAVRKDLRSASAERIRTFSVEEVRHLVRTAAIRPPRYTERAHLMAQCILLLGAFCGLRRGEINGLKAKHIDVDRQTLEVRHSLDRFHNLQAPKTAAGVRDVMVPAPLFAMLRAWLERFPPDSPDALVFTTRGGLPLNRQNFLRDVWHPLLKRADLLDVEDVFHFHALRHFAGSWMLDSGWSIPDVSLALGHANPNITMGIYAHSLRKRSHSLDAMDALASRLIGSSGGKPILSAADHACA